MSPPLTRLVWTLVAVGVVAVLVRQLLSAGGPEAAIVTQLKELERDGAAVGLPSGQLVGTGLSFQRILVVLDPDAEGATVTCTLDFTGRLVRPPPLAATQVSSLGLERARFRRQGSDWEAERGPFPRLVDIVSSLERRRLAIEQEPASVDGGHFPGVQQRRYQSVAWYVRSERGEITIAEDYALTGATLERPIDEKATTRLVLIEDAGVLSFLEGMR
jgi:hypothetical protein